ncbi:Nuclear autoantigenic sperm protein [Microtus ochrogaster]|uniref:Nuclear autoantigenic sperm protein n=1 Tax=Microtus ochrogaster TaxID=79684 RepID=A0A8J6G5C8_MICOH|nr:Nuclear autoantigenic sperm protein [Microtus ochrogaster]
MKGEAETVDAAVKSVGVGGEGPKDQVAASESELGMAVLDQLSGQYAVSPAVAAEAGSDVSEKPGQEITVLLNNGSVDGPSAAGDQTPRELQTPAERLTETKDGSSVEEVKAELVPEQEEAMLPVEESAAAGDGAEAKVAQRATVKAPEDKFKIAANVETQERDKQMKEGEETGGSEEEDKENDKAEGNTNDTVIENKSFQESEEENTGNLELVWDVLDLAKIICKSYNSQYDEAVAQFGRSIEVIEKRMAVLNEQMNMRKELRS